MTREEEKKKARWEYVSKRLANPDYPTYNDEYELECAYDAGAMWADAYPHWISVEDELPEKDGRYLFYDEVLGPQVSVYYDGCTLVSSITHWMPMPALPKSGSSEIPNNSKKGGE